MASSVRRTLTFDLMPGLIRGIELSKEAHYEKYFQKLTGAALALALLSCLAACGGVTQTEYVALVKERDALQLELDAMKQEPSPSPRLTYEDVVKNIMETSQYILCI